MAELETQLQQATAKGEPTAAIQSTLNEATQRASDGAANIGRFVTQGSKIKAEQLPGDGVYNEPWFTGALEKHNQFVKPVLDKAAVASGVDPANFLEPETAYVRMYSRERALDSELTQAKNLAAKKGADWTQRSPLRNTLLGRPQELSDFSGGAPPQGPQQADYAPGTGGGLSRPGAMRSGSAKQATGSADDYLTDYNTIISKDAQEKVVRGKINNVYKEVQNSGGRILGPGERPNADAGEVLFTGRRMMDPVTGEMKEVPMAVPLELRSALESFEKKMAGSSDDYSAAWKRFGNIATRTQISGMPVEATSHALRTMGHVASNPGNADAVGDALSLIPAVGPKAAATREIAGVDFKNPKTLALQDRLAEAGALRVEKGDLPGADTFADRGGALQWGHHALFGPEGVDRRARLVLADKLLRRNPNATNADLRKYINGQLGNYVPENAGALTNFMQQSGLSAFGRFQASSIPASIRRLVGVSDLPSTGVAQKLGDVASTLWRGPLGYYAGGNAANMAMTGHPMWENEKGHGLDVATGYAAGPGGFVEDPSMAGSRHKAPLYLPGAALDPVVMRGARATGLRQFVPQVSTSTAPGGQAGDAIRDVINTAAGTLSPAARAVSVMLTGTTPYVQSDGTMYRISDPQFDKGFLGTTMQRAKDALGRGNPALESFEAPSGMTQALAKDGEVGGGTASIASRIAQFLAPRVLTAGIGGQRSEANAGSRQEREVTDVITAAERRVKNAAGPIDQKAIIDDVVAKAEQAYGPAMGADVRKKLQAAANMPESKSLHQQENKVRLFQRKTVPGMPAQEDTSDPFRYFKPTSP